MTRVDVLLKLISDTESVW